MTFLDFQKDQVRVFLAHFGVYFFMIFHQTRFISFYFVHPFFTNLKLKAMSTPQVQSILYLNFFEYLKLLFKFKNG